MKKQILILAYFALMISLPLRAEEPSANVHAEADVPAMAATELDAEFQDIRITVEGNKVIVSGAEGHTLEVFNLAGVRVSVTKIEKDEQAVTLNLKHGCYILKVDKVVRKISIR